MLTIVRQFVHGVLVAAAVTLAGVPAICHAQESSLDLRTLTASFGAIPAPSLSPANDIVLAREPHAPPFDLDRTIDTRPARIGIFAPLYASFAGLQALDAHSTIRAIRHGGTERNPLLRELAGRPAALVALKAGVTASTILLTEKLRRKHRAGAIVLMAALDSFYTMVVVHNYRAVP